MSKSLGFEWLWRWRGSNTASGYHTYFYGIARYTWFFGVVLCPDKEVK